MIFLESPAHFNEILWLQAFSKEHSFHPKALGSARQVIQSMSNACALLIYNSQTG
jgi:hypothetical protein